MNSGVVLLDLEKIRKMNSSSQSSFFNVEKIRSYIKEFNIPTWGDQVTKFPRQSLKRFTVCVKSSDSIFLLTRKGIFF